MPQVNSAASSPLDAPSSNIPSMHRDAVEQVPALAADLHRERHPEQALLRRLAVEVARHLAGVLPLLEVRRHLAPGELPSRRAQRLALVSSIERLVSSIERLVSSIERKSRSQQPLRDLDVPRPRPLAEPLGLRVEPRRGGDAAAEQPVHHDVDPAEVGQREDLDLERRGLREQVADEVRSDQPEQPRRDRVVVVTVASWTRDDRLEVARRGRPTGRGWRRRPCRRTGRARTCRAVLSRHDLGPAVGMVHGVRDGRAVDVLRAVDAVRRAVAGRRGHREAGVRREGELHCGAAEGAADRLGCGVLDGAAEQGRGALLGVGVRAAAAVRATR